MTPALKLQTWWRTPPMRHGLAKYTVLIRDASDPEHEALWDLVESGELEYTPTAPVYFRARKAEA